MKEVQYYGLSGVVDVRVPEDQASAFEAKPNFSKHFTKDKAEAEASAEAKRVRDAAKTEAAA